MHIHPPSGGDTLWASGVEMYQRMSPPMQKYLQTLTITADQQDNFIGAEKSGGFELWTEPRGHPLNSGKNFTAKHPVVRTNPVTGLNSIYGVGLHVKKINDVTKAESDYLMQMFLDTVTRNHDLQVRFRWEPKSCAIWDNRSVSPQLWVMTDNRSIMRLLQTLTTNGNDWGYVILLLENSLISTQRRRLPRKLTAMGSRMGQPMESTDISYRLLKRRSHTRGLAHSVYSRRAWK